MNIAITGGCGFLGTNVALKLFKRKHAVVCIDDLSRVGSESNRELLEEVGVTTVKSDFCHFNFKPFDVVLHYAAQVTVTNSVLDPIDDFTTNIAKTMIMIDKVGRDVNTTPVFIFASTNKVYGLGDDDIIGEDFPRGYTSPYALSKGTADHYFEMLGGLGFIRSLVLRQSCLYGSHQYGIEGQGWLAWFMQKIVKGEKLTIFGDGQQVRDVLEARDYASLIANIVEHPNLREIAKGEVFNIGGGPENALSLIEAVDMISGITGKKPKIKFDVARLGDQKHFVCDISKAYSVFGWHPKIGPERGITDLYKWVKERQACSTF